MRLKSFKELIIHFVDQYYSALGDPAMEKAFPEGRLEFQVGVEYLLGLVTIL